MVKQMTIHRFSQGITSIVCLFHFQGYSKKQKYRSYFSEFLTLKYRDKTLNLKRAFPTSIKDRKKLNSCPREETILPSTTILPENRKNNVLLSSAEARCRCFHARLLIRNYIDNCQRKVFKTYTFPSTKVISTIYELPNYNKTYSSVLL